jgi:hypothetical protein
LALGAHRLAKAQIARLPRIPHIPLRDDEVVALGRATRLKYAGRSIEEVARQESIILQIASYAELKRGGISICQAIDTFYVFESLVDPDRFIESRYPAFESTIKLIAIAHDHIRDAEAISLDEIFWHEYFHLNWSPELEPFDPAKHEYTTHGVLDKQDEARADLFAASVLIDRVEPWDDARSIMQKFDVSHLLASLALRIEHNKHLFSRDWTPVYE